MRELTLDSENFAELSAEILTVGGAFRFRASGTSMLPFIKDGAFLTVRPADSDALKAGEVVLYLTGPGRTLAHRIVGLRDEFEGRRFLLRGDAAAGPAEVVEADRIIGRISEVSQDGVTRTLHPGGRLLLAVVSVYGLWRRFAVTVLGTLQSFTLYRLLMRKLSGRDVRYRQAEPKDAEGLSRLYGYSNSPEPAPAAGSLREIFENPTAADNFIVALCREQVVGAVSISVFKEGDPKYADWCIFGTTVRLRRRGRGIGEGLTVAAIEKARGEGGRGVNLTVFANNKPAVNLYRKLGFETTSSPVLDEELRESGTSIGRRRIIMRKTLTAEDGAQKE